MSNFHNTGRTSLKLDAAAAAGRRGSQTPSRHALAAELRSVRNSSSAWAEEPTFSPWALSNCDGAFGEEDRTIAGGSSSSGASSRGSRTRRGPRLQPAHPLRDERQASGVASETVTPATGSVRLPARSAAAAAAPDTATMTMVHCLFAFAFAALTLGMLTFVGLVVQTNSTCPPAPGYSTCAVWQDFRSIMSFFMGAILCWLFTNGKERAVLYAAETSEKVQLYAYML